MSLADQLEEKYLKDGDLSWKKLGAGVTGGLFTAAWAGFIRMPQAIGEALEAYYGGLADGIGSGVGEIETAITIVSARVWEPFSAGLLSLPVTIAFVLVLFLIVTAGISYATE